MAHAYRLLVLRIYQAPDGRWAGRLMIGNEDLGWIVGLVSATEVEQAVRETGIGPDHVEVRTPTVTTSVMT